MIDYRRVNQFNISHQIGSVVEHEGVRKRVTGPAYVSSITRRVYVSVNGTIQLLSSVTLITDSDPDPEFVRAGGDVICETCGKKYYDHSRSLEYIDNNRLPWLNVLCDGRLVKL